jgi:formylglycine-generating enzyme required for sulfatase activity
LRQSLNFLEVCDANKELSSRSCHVRANRSLIALSNPVDLKNVGEWRAYTKDADWRHSNGPKSNINTRDNHPVVQVASAYPPLQAPQSYDLSRIIEQMKRAELNKPRD